MTKKLYYQDSHIHEFTAVVLSCEEKNDHYLIELDQTAFFPEGGGQYADIGRIDDVEIFDVHEKNGIVYHYGKAPLSIGNTVRGKIDWERRFESMQQHTGEHIVSGIVHERFGYDNVGFHLGDDYCTMDFNGPITKDELLEIEKSANGYVFQNLKVNVMYPDKEELASLTYRSKIEIEGQVRIVNIPGVDTCACCAPHVKYTGEIGLIKLVDMVNYKGGQRITMQAGFRALSDYREKEQSVKCISASLCVKEADVAASVDRLKEEIAALKGQLVASKGKLLKIQSETIDIHERIVTVFDAALKGNEPRELMNLLLEKGAYICAVFAGDDANGFRYVIGSKEQDVRLLSKSLNAAFSGRGGGKPNMVQGTLVGQSSKIREFLQSQTED